MREILASRRHLIESTPLPARKAEAEGGCGVIGFASSTQLEGRYLLASLFQMKNRGNGKGGGVAAVGLSHETLEVSQDILDEDYLLQVAYLDPTCQSEVEAQQISHAFEVDHTRTFPCLLNEGSAGLDIPPPEVVAYFVRPRRALLEEFSEKNALAALPDKELEEEYVYQQSFQLNTKYYASLGKQRAFVLSHGKNMVVFKLVGYGDQVIKAYGLEDFPAHVWVGHHRYPTKGRVWHPGGAHPFVGLNEALVHNGDFANYHSITQYLRQHHIAPLFLTDTEVSVLLFDLFRRTYRYPLEFVIEALAPTTERDFEMIPQGKRRLYKKIQQAHLHGSPDGPWFFIIASNHREPMDKQSDTRSTFELIGITDTSMLRPQVFSLQEGELRIGLIGSERQGIDAILRALYEDGKAPTPYADLYWNARGGSHTDGGAFVFSIAGDGDHELTCRNKFGDLITAFPTSPPETDWKRLEQLRTLALEKNALSESRDAISELTHLLDFRSSLNGIRCASVSTIAEEGLEKIFLSLPSLGSSAPFQVATWENREQIHQAPSAGTLVIDGKDFPPEGDESLARFLVLAYERGFRDMVCCRLRGHRFLGCGLGESTERVKIELYGSSGDYLGSGLDGGELTVHGSAQDQVGNIMKSGKLVIHGDVGQCFLYGAKGGEIFVRGNAAGRPLINAVNAPRLVLNGTALDYLAESFMAGDPLDGGGFAIVNGITFQPGGGFQEQSVPYPGGNLFSLASGGAIYVRDPGAKVTKDQLNGGEFQPFTKRDFEVILPYLEENERLFGIRVNDLLSMNGHCLSPDRVYRKVGPKQNRYLQA